MPTAAKARSQLFHAISQCFEKSYANPRDWLSPNLASNIKRI